LTLDLVLNDLGADVVEEGQDVAILIGMFSDSSRPVRDFIPGCLAARFGETLYRDEGIEP